MGWPISSRVKRKPLNNWTDVGENSPERPETTSETEGLSVAITILRSNLKNRFGDKICLGATQSKKRQARRKTSNFFWGVGGAFVRLKSSGKVEAKKKRESLKFGGCRG